MSTAQSTFRELQANGLRVFPLPVAGTSALSMLLAFDAGARAERAEENGIAHFLEHLVFKGGDRYPTGEPGGPHLYDVAIRLFEQPLPIVAAVQGAAIGGGLGLALAADFRVAAPEARFAANFALLGFHQGFAISVTLPAVVGQQKALDLLYTGRRINGEQAHAIGLADRLAASGQAREEAHALAAESAASGPLAVRSIRQTMRAALADEARTAMSRERAEQDRLRQTEDWKEGVAAVNARRPANFTGR
jgi:enoyl-CoA hydratase/carnithine racemase